MAESNKAINQSVWQSLRKRILEDEERLNKTAIIDCSREYTYSQMLKEWQRYARVFSGLNIGKTNKSRVAIAGSISAEPIFAFYALNMVGAEVSMFSYPDFLPTGNWKTMAEKEKITDLVLSDIMITPKIWGNICREKQRLGIKNVILLHSRLGGPSVGPAELIYNEFNLNALRRIPGTLFMDDLLEKYAYTPINYNESDGSDIAIITHTSGTTHGTRKPLPYTDSAVNVVSANLKGGFGQAIFGSDFQDQLRVAIQFDCSSFLCMCGQVNCSLTAGDTIVLTCFGFLHPKFIKAVEYYKVNVLNTSSFMVDSWLERKDLDSVDLSSVKIMAVGGSYTPTAKLEKYYDFLRSHGCTCHIQRGYGMSETGGVQLMCPPGSDEDILGFSPDKQTVRIQNEVDDKFYTVDDGPLTGIMYITSESMCLNELDGTVLFDFTEIEGRNYVCTNDLVRLNEDGSLSYAGRADKFFVNNDGKRFDSGIVDVAMSAHPAINKCAVVPVLEKRIHDTVPVLYVVPATKGKGAAEDVRKAFCDVYIRDKKIAPDNIPTQFMLVEDIPCNTNGKLDIFRITRERLQGEAYNIVPVCKDGELKDIKAEYNDNLNSITAGTLPEGMGMSSAFNIFDLFN